MYLNDLHPAVGSRKKKVRIGRGMGSGLGKTCGFGHKGQKARSGYSQKVGFEGGQLPLHRRLPKFGFSSRKSKQTDEVSLGELNKIKVDTVDLSVLQAQGLVNHMVKRVKVILSGELTRPVIIQGIKVTAGAKKAIEAAGGRVE